MSVRTRGKILWWALPSIILMLLFLPCCEDSSSEPVEETPGAHSLLPELPADIRAVWNPMGGTIAYQHCQRWRDPDPSGIYLINEDGSDERLIIPWGESPDWHPLGEKIAFMRGGNIGIYDLNTTEIKMLTSGRSRNFPSFSSDSKYLAFSHTTDVGLERMSYAIVIYDLEADSSYYLPRPPDGDPYHWYYCDWRPNSYELIFERKQRHIWCVDFMGDSLRFIVDGKWPRWSPDGTEICFIDYEETKILNVETGRKERIGIKWDANFSNDGRRIVYTKRVGDQMDPYSGKRVLRIYDRETGEEIELTN